MDFFYIGCELHPPLVCRMASMTQETNLCDQVDKVHRVPELDVLVANQ